MSYRGFNLRKRYRGLTFRRKVMKKTVRSIAIMLVIAVAVAFSPVFSLNADAVTQTGYKAAAAVSFAKNNKTNYKDCVKFARMSVQKGGIPAQKGRNYEFSPVQYMKYLTTEGFAVSNPLTLCGDSELESTTKYANLCVEDNKGKVAKGDILLYKCKKCGKYFHMAVVTDTANGAGNGRHYWIINAQRKGETQIRNLPMYKFEHNGHGRGNVVLYALHFTSSSNGFKALTKTVKKLKAKKVTKKKAKLTWKKASGAVAYNIYARGYAGGPVEFVKQVKGTSAKVAIPKNSKGKVYNYKNVKFAVAPVYKKSVTFEGVKRTYKIPAKKCKLVAVK